MSKRISVNLIVLLMGIQAALFAQDNALTEEWLFAPDNYVVTAAKYSQKESESPSAVTVIILLIRRHFRF